MSKRRIYDEEADKLVKAIDIAIEAFSVKCPADFDRNHQQHFISCYTEWKENCLHPEPKFKNLTSLKYLVEDVFTYFQEGTGPTVEYFWNKIKEENLPYERENKLQKILDRGKLKDQIEYEYVIDMIIVAEQIGMTTAIQTKTLNELLEQFEAKRK